MLFKQLNVNKGMVGLFGQPLDMIGYCNDMQMCIPIATGTIHVSFFLLMYPRCCMLLETNPVIFIHSMLLFLVV